MARGGCHLCRIAPSPPLNSSGASPREITGGGGASHLWRRPHAVTPTESIFLRPGTFRGERDDDCPGSGVGRRRQLLPAPAFFAISSTRARDWRRVATPPTGSKFRATRGPSTPVHLARTMYAIPETNPVEKP